MFKCSVVCLRTHPKNFMKIFNLCKEIWWNKKIVQDNKNCSYVLLHKLTNWFIFNASLIYYWHNNCNWLVLIFIYLCENILILEVLKTLITIIYVFKRKIIENIMKLERVWCWQRYINLYLYIRDLNYTFLDRQSCSHAHKFVLMISIEKLTSISLSEVVVFNGLKKILILILYNI